MGMLPLYLVNEELLKGRLYKRNRTFAVLNELIDIILYFMKQHLLLSSILGCMLFASPVSADVVGFSTAVPVGEKMSFALNENVKATVAWGDGSSEQVTFTGSEVELTVKHADFTVSTSNMITRIFCPDCSLTSLNLEDVPNLISLVCPDNKLTTLNLKTVPMLTELNCEGNEMTSLSFVKCPELEILNCSRNQLKSLPLAYQNKLKTLICGYNKLTNLAVTNMKNLETLWCQGNDLTSVSLGNHPELLQICAYDNELKSLNFSTLTSTNELWLDNNKFKSLDLSKSPIAVLSASNNDLDLIRLEEELASEMTDFYVDNNSLLPNSFPVLVRRNSTDSLMNYNISNQRPYVFIDKVNLNEKVNMVDILRYNAFGNNIRPSVEWTTSDGTVLVKNIDFKVGNYIFTFLKPFKSVSGQVVSTFYPNETFNIANFEVVDPTGVEEVNATNEMVVVAKNGKIEVSVATATPVQIYNVGGVKLVDEVVSAGSNAWTLPSGIYIVNGKKVVLNH